jgi:hypothetical protein
MRRYLCGSLAQGYSGNQPQDPPDDDGGWVETCPNCGGVMHGWARDEDEECRCNDDKEV